MLTKVLLSSLTQVTHMLKLVSISYWIHQAKPGDTAGGEPHCPMNHPHRGGPCHVHWQGRQLSIGRRGGFLPNSTVSGELGSSRVSDWPHSSVTIPSQVSEPPASPLNGELERQHTQSTGPSASLLTRSWPRGPPTPPKSMEMGPPQTLPGRPLSSI